MFSACIKKSRLSYSLFSENVLMIYSQNMLLGTHKILKNNSILFIVFLFLIMQFERSSWRLWYYLHQTISLVLIFVFSFKQIYVREIVNYLVIYCSELTMTIASIDKRYRVRSRVVYFLQKNWLNFLKNIILYSPKKGGGKGMLTLKKLGLGQKKEARTPPPYLCFAFKERLLFLFLNKRL